MNLRTALLLAALAAILGLPAVAALLHPVMLSEAPGGPPVIHLAGKQGGGLRAADLAKAATLGLHGCVADARVVAFTITIMDCNAQPCTLAAKGPELTEAMRSAIGKLPANATFTIEAEVRDASGRAWPVKNATFNWQR